tara:strand:+ start:577 stop:747 length:171 start_codon:yes stop_codon:yes gene_type:complete
MDKQTDKKEEIICCICEKKFEGHGHNPLPLYNKEGRCCTTCNFIHVLPARLILNKK